MILRKYFENIPKNTHPKWQVQIPLIFLHQRNAWLGGPKDSKKKQTSTKFDFVIYFTLCYNVTLCIRIPQL